MNGRFEMSRFEDALGKLLMIVTFSILTAHQIKVVLAIIDARESIDFWEFALSTRLLNLAFLCLVVGITLVRLPPTRNAEGIEPRLSALIGTFALMLLVVLPTGSAGLLMLLVANVLVATGTALSIFALAWLGRAFSIMASARRLVTSGPYSVIRHPLYAAEAISVIGIVIANWSLLALLVGSVQVAFQVRRMFNEERILRQVFPEYDAYSRRVPMVVPRLLSRPATGLE